MPVTLDWGLYSQLRYTIRLEWFNPEENNIQYEYFYMTEDEFSSESYYRILSKHKELVHEECNLFYGFEITEINEFYHENRFSEYDILSDEVVKWIKLDKDNEIVIPGEDCEEFNRREKEMAFAYLSELFKMYSASDVAKEILSVTRNPKYEYADRIMSRWGIYLRPTYIEHQLRCIISKTHGDTELQKLLKSQTSDNLRSLKSKLERLDSEWGLSTMEDKHLQAILIYRFFQECSLTCFDSVSWKEAMQIIYTYLDIPMSTYTKTVQLTEPTRKEYGAYDAAEDLDNITKRKCKLYRKITSKWANFKRNL